MINMLRALSPFLDPPILPLLSFLPSSPFSPPPLLTHASCEYRHSSGYMLCMLTTQLQWISRDMKTQHT